MWSESRKVAAGDLVVIWMTREALLPLTIVPGQELNGRFGVYRHNDLIGTPYGSKVISRNGRGYVHVLRPTPELWTLALPHRTQILYVADIAFVISWLNIKPGSVVIEAGTGSGSFSHSVARTIGSGGHLHSFEYHEERAKKAKAEFSAHGMDNCVTSNHRNVCKDGFNIENVADAVFLDLPAPWDAIDHARKALKKDRTTRICCYSPCMEQVLRTVTSLNDAGFTEITMYETLIRPQEVVPVALPSIDTAVNKLRKAEGIAEARRLRQIEIAKTRNAKRKRGADDESNDSSGTPVTTNDKGVNDKNPSSKRKRRNSIPQDALEVPDEAWDGEGGEVPASLLTIVEPTGQDEASSPIPQGSASSSQLALHVAHPFTEVRGHTSYLTFAVLAPYAFVTGAQVTTATRTSSSTIPETIPDGSNRNAQVSQIDESQMDASFQETEAYGNDSLDDAFRSIPEAEFTRQVDAKSL